ncbi:MAG: type III pantothenate kinase [Bacteroidales bacterium]|nr:type III pantothenate kinase [Bacteroidales bacterium]
MNLTIDIGNTAVKWATFEDERLVAHGVGLPEGVAVAGQVLVCASGEVPAGLAALPRLTADTALPLRLDYKTPQTLGADRVAAACGAWALHPGEDCLVIDAGTCITVDFVDRKGVYHGGAILPGLEMNLRSLHTFTAKLPLISLEGVSRAPVLGRSTEESILAGTLGATMLALAGFVALYRQKSEALRVLLTGGDAGRLTAAGTSGWEVQPLLTLIGLNKILMTCK